MLLGVGEEGALYVDVDNASFHRKVENLLGTVKGMKGPRLFINIANVKAVDAAYESVEEIVRAEGSDRFTRRPARFGQPEYDIQRRKDDAPMRGWL
jgi:hypothetical protein